MNDWTPLMKRELADRLVGYRFRYRVPNDGMRCRFVQYKEGIHRLCVFAGNFIIPIDNRDGYELLEVQGG